MKSIKDQHASTHGSSLRLRRVVPDLPADGRQQEEQPDRYCLLQSTQSSLLYNTGF